MGDVTTSASVAALSKNATPHSPEQFPFEGKVRAKKAASHLSIGVSTWWLYVAQGRVKPPLKLSPRVSVWDASYIRELAEYGIPALEKGAKCGDK